MRVTTSLIIAGTESKEGIYVTAITGINIPVIAKTTTAKTWQNPTSAVLGLVLLPKYSV